MIKVHGHRGARAAFPENTIPGFLYAIDAGVDAVELDMAVTKDNAVVISHDPVLRPPVCRGPRQAAVIRELTLAQVRQWECGFAHPDFPGQTPLSGAKIPTLDEVFQLAPRGSFEFNIEAKVFPEHPEVTPSPEEFSLLVSGKIHEYGLEKRVVLLSFDFRTLAAMRRLAPEIRLSALTHDAQMDFASVARQAQADIISPQHTLVTAEEVAAAHAEGFPVVSWTANTCADWDRLVAAGVDGIVTDDPAGLIAFLKARGLR